MQNFSKPRYGRNTLRRFANEQLTLRSPYPPTRCTLALPFSFVHIPYNFHLEPWAFMTLFLRPLIIVNLTNGGREEYSLI